MESYTITDHIYNYAVWIAARAVQRNFTSTKFIKSAIEYAGLKKIIDNNELSTPEQFDNFHRKTANEIIKYLRDKNIKTTYGQASKIIAIYIKTAVIIRNSGSSELARIAHPPIDSILLKKLNEKYKNLELNNYRWTQLTETKYFEIINKLRTLEFSYFWEIEKYWMLTA